MPFGTPDPLVMARVQAESNNLPRAIRTLENACAPLRMYCAHLLLSDQQYIRGWEHYQARTTRDHFRIKHPGKLLEKFDNAPIAIGSVAVVGEQGIGDQLAFLRWLPIFGPCTLYIHPKLLPILPANIASVVKPYRWEDRTAIDEAHAILLGDLPHLLQLHRIPAPIPLTVSPFAPIKPAGEIRIGIAWESGIAPGEQSGTTLHTYKSLPLDDLIRFTNTLQCTLVNLQRNAAPDDLAQLKAHSTNPVFTPMPSVHDDLATLVEQLRTLDSYVGVSSTTTHLLASLEKPAHIFVPYPWDFRFAPGKSSPWFPTFHTYHQTPRGEWDAAFEQCAFTLSGTIAFR